MLLILHLDFIFGIALFLTNGKRTTKIFMDLCSLPIFLIIKAKTNKKQTLNMIRNAVLVTIHTVYFFEFRFIFPGFILLIIQKPYKNNIQIHFKAPHQH